MAFTTHTGELTLFNLDYSNKSFIEIQLFGASVITVRIYRFT